MTVTRTIALLCFVLACGGSAMQSTSDDSWFEEDDGLAAPICGSECVSANYGNANVLRVIHEVARCWKQPVYVGSSVSGLVSVQFKNLTCAEAIQRVAEAARLQLLAIEGGKPTGQLLAGGAIALARTSRPSRLVDIFRRTAGGSGDADSERQGQSVCRSKCSSGWSSCQSNCSNTAAPESCMNRCKLLRDSCRRACAAR